MNNKNKKIKIQLEIQLSYNNNKYLKDKSYQSIYINGSNISLALKKIFFAPHW